LLNPSRSRSYTGHLKLRMAGQHHTIMSRFFLRNGPGRSSIEPRVVGRWRTSFRWKSATATTSHLHPLYPHVFTPLDLGPAGILPNRILMGSMHTGLEGHSLPKWMESYLMPGAVHDHTLERMAKYFETRAKGGVGLMVTGTSYVLCVFVHKMVQLLLTGQFPSPVHLV
jgi:2,4-dienoyl-CoA reductase (NADPH2)